MPHSYTPTFMIDIWEANAFENELSTKRKQHVFSESTLNLKKSLFHLVLLPIFYNITKDQD
jgi:hypothetical protein